MPQVSFIGPLDQPLGSRRLLSELRVCLTSGLFTSFRIIVAYAKSGPLLRLRTELTSFKGGGGVIEAILGIDQQGTSREAVQLSLSLMDSVYVTSEPGITFHPKIYIFEGPHEARCIIGSNNLTVGGTETNFETAMILDLSLPGDQAQLQQVQQLWSQLLPAACPATSIVDQAALAALVASGDLPDEVIISRKTAAASNRVGPRRPKSGLAVKPASALPKAALALPQQQANAGVAVILPVAPAAQINVVVAPAQRFAIQIKPHGNGEIFLSVTAALQNPAFFKWPFSGATTPKKVGNPSYPQLDPDPIVDIDVFAAGNIPVLSLKDYELNTVYYATNSEIRVTASPLVGIVPDYSVMVMEPNPRPGIDYQITIYTPASSAYVAWEAACNQQMPGGGKQPRKFGWF